MILLAAGSVWLVLLAYISFTPRLTPETRRFVRDDLLVLGLIGLLTIGFFWQILFTTNAWKPAGGGDLAAFLYPTYHFAQEWILRGIIPLWNPYIFGGMPFVGDIQTALFYPLNLITYLLSNPLTYRDLEELAILHYYIAGAGMYLLLRYGPLKAGGGGLGRAAALAGALAFQFSDVFIIHFGNLNLIASAAWLPWVFLCFARALEHLRSSSPAKKKIQSALPAAITAGFLLSIAFFAGHTQSFLFIVLTLALFAAYLVVVELLKVQGVLGLAMLIFFVGMGLSAITLLPGLELASLSVRSAFSYQDAAQFSLPPIQLVGLFVPGFFGRAPLEAWGPWERVEVGYIGVFPLILALYGLILRRNSRTMFFAGIALVGLLLALGGYAVLHGWLYQFFPGFGQLRAPARFVLLLDFGLAALAAIGFDAIAGPMVNSEHRLFTKLTSRGVWVALILALVSGGLALGILILGQGLDPTLFQRIANAANALGFFIFLLALSVVLLFIRARAWLDPRIWSVLAVALIYFDLASLGAGVDVGTSDPTLAYQRGDVIEFLRSNTDLARIDSRTDVEGLWRPDAGLLHRLQDVYGDNPLVLSIFHNYWEGLGSRETVGYARLNVRYALTRRETPMPAVFQKVFEGGGGITLHENTCALPRAWVVYDTQVASDWGATIQALREPCEQGVSTRIPSSAAISGEGARDLDSSLPGSDTVLITGYSPNVIEAQVDAAQNGYVIFSEVFVPGWQAYVDGSETPIYRADYLFRAVEVPQGTHTVRMEYNPMSFRIGVIISAATLGLVIVAQLWALKSKRGVTTPDVTPLEKD